jgi:hypothetical protein
MPPANQPADAKKGCGAMRHTPENGLCSGGQTLDRNPLVHAAEEPAGFFPAQFTVRGNLAADKALVGEHVLKRIRLNDELSTTFRAAGSNHRDLLKSPDLLRTIAVSY